jgi:hypothetical protein
MVSKTTPCPLCGREMTGEELIQSILRKEYPEEYQPIDPLQCDGCLGRREIFVFLSPTKTPELA